MPIVISPWKRRQTRPTVHSVLGPPPKIPMWVYSHIPFVGPPSFMSPALRSRHLGCVRCLAISNNGVVNILVLCEGSVGEISGSGITGSEAVHIYRSDRCCQVSSRKLGSVHIFSSSVGEGLLLVISHLCSFFFFDHLGEKWHLSLFFFLFCQISEIPLLDLP